MMGKLAAVLLTPFAIVGMVLWVTLSLLMYPLVLFVKWYNGT